MAEPDPRVLAAIWRTVRRRRSAGLFVLGLCGAQGSGKSTLARALLRQADEQGMAAAALSLDDLYLTHAARAALAREVHPLLRTRGVPGTHDIALGLEVLDALARGEPALLPRFDKARDDRLPRAAWDRAPAHCALLVFEGWCLGARPQEAAALRAPVNALEANEDADGRWRAWVNAALAGPYQKLFARIDALALLAAPGFEVVFDWRLQAENELRAAGPAPRTMDAPGIARFVEHYERLTRHILAEMPPRADLLVRLAADRSVVEIRRGRQG
jgi:D-glycerate 3-kinase